MNVLDTLENTFIKMLSDYKAPVYLPIHYIFTIHFFHVNIKCFLYFDLVIYVWQVNLYCLNSFIYLSILLIINIYIWNLKLCMQITQFICQYYTQMRLYMWFHYKQINVHLFYIWCIINFIIYCKKEDDVGHRQILINSLNS